MDTILVQVYEDLLPLLSAVAQEIFVDYYKPINGIESAEYMADKFLSEEAIKEQIEHDYVYKLMLKDGLPVGFCAYKIDGNRVFLSKLYMNKLNRNKGLGKLMLQDCIEYARKNNKKAIYLTVNKHNKTVDKYKHMGFVTIDSVVTDIGGGFVMDDYIMELTI